MNNDDVVKLYKDSLARPFADSTIKGLLDMTVDWDDPVAVQISDTEPYDEAAFRGIADKSIAGHIMRRLGHLVVNPRSKARTNAIVESYVFPYENESRLRMVNNRPEDAKAFLEFLISNARRQSKIDDVEQYLQVSDYVVVYGRRGCGKTCCLNFLLSKYSERLDKRNTIWVRINLVEHYNSASDLSDIIRLQQAKVICRYYDKNSKEIDQNSKKKFLDVEKRLQDYIDGKKNWDKLRKKEEMRDVEAFLEVFYDKRKDRSITSRFVPIMYCDEIRQYALEEGYSFIVVLDGLDQLEITSRSIARHRELVQMAYELSNKLDESKEFYVFVCRKMTFLQDNIPFTVGASGQYEVIDPELKNILDYRINVMVKEFYDIKKRYGWTNNKDEYEAEIAEFKDYIEDVEVCHDENGQESCESIIESLEKHFSHNKRACMQMVQVYYHNFLRERKEKFYLITENIVKCGKGFPPKYYGYSIAEDNGHFIHRVNNEPRKFDNIFLNSIFNFPLAKPERNKQAIMEVFDGFNYGIEYLLLGTRMLQLISAYEFLLKNNDANSPLTVNDLLEILDILFNYNCNVVERLIEEYNDLQLVVLSKKDFESNSIRKCEVRLMPKAQLMIDNYLFQLAYLNLAAMRIVLPPTMNKIEDTPLVVASTLDGGCFSLPHWIGSKLINSRTAYQFIRDLNSSQESGYEENLDYLDEWTKTIAVQAQSCVSPDHGGMFEFHVKLQDFLVHQVEAMFPSDVRMPFHKDNDLIAERFTSYCDKYYALGAE